MNTKPLNILSDLNQSTKTEARDCGQNGELYNIHYTQSPTHPTQTAWLQGMLKHTVDELSLNPPCSGISALSLTTIESWQCYLDGNNVSFKILNLLQFHVVSLDLLRHKCNVFFFSKDGNRREKHKTSQLDNHGMINQTSPRRTKLFWPELVLSFCVRSLNSVAGHYSWCLKLK